MYTLVGFENGLYVVRDSDDNAIDIIDVHDATLALKCGMSIGGLQLNTDDSLSYEDTYFPKAVDISEFLPSSEELEFAEDDEEEDDYNDYELEDKTFDTYEGYDDDEEEIEGESEDLGDEYSDEEYEDDYDDDYYEEDELDSTVSKLYTYLTDEQKTLLQKYYLWYSQRIFSEGQKDPSLGIKSKSRLEAKKADLNYLRNQGGLWHYAGFVDTGYFGGGYCTLGHKLRYMHLAWDVTVSDIETAFFGQDYDKNFEDAVNSNNCIVFGLKCIGDFFEVDSECMKALQRAQRESLKDMALMFSYYEGGIVEEVKSTFGVLDEFIQKSKAVEARNILMRGNNNTEGVLPASFFAFYLQFRGLGMVPPKSLVQEIRDKLVGWASHKFTPSLGHISWDVFAPKIEVLFGKKADALLNLMKMPYGGQIQRYLKSYFEDYILYKSCGYYEYDADKNKDEGGCSKNAKYELSCLKRDVDSLWKDVQYTWDYIQKICSVLTLITKYVGNDDKYCVPQRYKDENDGFYKVSEERTSRSIARMSDYCDTTGSKLYDSVEYLNDIHSRYALRRELRNTTIDEFTNKLNNCVSVIDNELETYISWVIAKEQEYCDKENEKIRKLIDEREQRRLEEERIKQEKENAPKETTVENMMECLKVSNLDLVTDYDFPKQVFQTVIKSGKEPSDKQLIYIKKLFEAVLGRPIKVIGVPDIPERIYLVDRTDLKEAIEWIIKNENKSDDRTVDICKSVLRYGSISDRQMKYVLSAKELYDKEKEV